MEQLGFLKLLEIVSQFGLAGVVLVIWYKSDRSREKMLNAYRDDMTAALKQYQEDMEETRQMYKNNVHLVEAYEDLAKDLKDVVIMNTQAMTRMNDDINRNQFCPMVRLEKRAPGPVVNVKE